VTISQLPTLNAVLNSLSAVFLITGYFLIRHRKIRLHRFFMISAFITSMLFFTSYMIYHLHAGSKHFPGVGAARSVYFTILISHTILAASIPVLAIITLTFGLRSRFDRHRRIARWTLPLWLYVSITGVVIYWMLYRVSWRLGG
jgi:putative membrane protein